MIRWIVRFNIIFSIVTMSSVCAQTTLKSPHKKITRDCADCHSADQWTQIHFDHGQTRLPLNFKHKDLSCLLCHDLADFNLVETQCAGCHTDIHQTRLGRQCERCHDEQGWHIFSPEKAHANTVFPLLGAHARLDCKVCHHGEIQGEYTLLSSDCYSCHAELFSQTQNPDHVRMRFPQRCEQCHSFFSWTPADFGDHNAFFPINSGNHAGVWKDCSTCHIDTGNYKEFSCFTNCHEHNKRKMDSEHHEVTGYSYDSHRCHNCHPRGSGGD